MSGKGFNLSGGGGAEGDSADGLSMLDVLTLPDDQQQAINWLMRQGKVSFAQVVAHMGEDETAARTMLDTLMAKGFVRETPVDGQPHYHTQLAGKKKRELPPKIWKALE
ncbi:FeoC-like transcriptional regulator [Kamptonema formosum]|uniref:FeoC-like transcriptional regulator n=1 Tax=Kamptonema formosum TaxID=331992 RepID=UPI0003495F10|nr:FeoC-like transcriptional regulator [Oscillatoria sp. PCC 10802]